MDGSGQLRQRRAVFLDRDGTIIEERGFLSDPEQVRLLPGAGAAIRAINNEGWLAIIVSNQSGVGRGFFAADALRRVQQHVERALSDEGGRIDDFLCCPHAPEDNCACRKPNPGLLLAASRSHGIAMKDSWVVGDKASDVEAGRRAGCRTCLVLTGYGSKDVANAVLPDLVATDLLAAVYHILGIMGIKGDTTQ